MPANQPQERERLLRGIRDLLRCPFSLRRGRECDDVPTDLVLGCCSLQSFMQHSPVCADNRSRQSFVELLLQVPVHIFASKSDQCYPPEAWHKMTVQNRALRPDCARLQFTDMNLVEPVLKPSPRCQILVWER